MRIIEQTHDGWREYEEPDRFAAPASTPPEPANPADEIAEMVREAFEHADREEALQRARRDALCAVFGIESSAATAAKQVLEALSRVQV